MPLLLASHAKVTTPRLGQGITAGQQSFDSSHCPQQVDVPVIDAACIERRLAQQNERQLVARQIAEAFQKFPNRQWLLVAERLEWKIPSFAWLRNLARFNLAHE